MKAGNQLISGFNQTFTELKPKLMNAAGFMITVS